MDILSMDALSLAVGFLVGIVVTVVCGGIWMFDAMGEIEAWWRA